MRFVHETAPQRVRFASGDAADQLDEEISTAGVGRLMVIADESARDAAVRLTEDRLKEDRHGPASPTPRHHLRRHTNSVTAARPQRRERLERAGTLHRLDVGTEGGPDQHRLRRWGRALRTGLPMIKDDPAGLPGREHALYGAYLSARAFASAGVWSASQDLSRARWHVRPAPCPDPRCGPSHVLAANAPHAVEVEHRIAEALDSETAREGLRSLQQVLDAPTALRDYGNAGGRHRSCRIGGPPASARRKPRPADDRRSRLAHTSGLGGSAAMNVSRKAPRREDGAIAFWVASRYDLLQELVDRIASCATGQGSAGGEQGGAPAQRGLSLALQLSGASSVSSGSSERQSLTVSTIEQSSIGGGDPQRCLPNVQLVAG
jgi:hypothetical protein